MIIICPQCQSQYQLADGVFQGKAGVSVRCTTCRYRWFQAAPETETIILQEEIQPHYADVPSGVLPGEVPPSSPATEKFGDILDQVSGDTAPLPAIHGGQGFEAPTYDVPQNITANQFGGLVFLLMLFLTLIPVFVFKGVITRHVPSSVAFYHAIGFKIAAPGEGLRIDALDAEYQISKSERVLMANGKLVNISDKEMTYPGLHVLLLGEDGKVIKEWSIKADKTKVLESGEAVPLKFGFKDAPDKGVQLTVKVAESG